MEEAFYCFPLFSPASPPPLPQLLCWCLLNYKRISCYLLPFPSQCYLAITRPTTSRAHHPWLGRRVYWSSEPPTKPRMLSSPDVIGRVLIKLVCVCCLLRGGAVSGHFSAQGWAGLLSSFGLFFFLQKRPSLPPSPIFLPAASLPSLLTRRTERETERELCCSSSFPSKLLCSSSSSSLSLSPSPGCVGAVAANLPPPQPNRPFFLFPMLPSGVVWCCWSIRKAFFGGEGEGGEESTAPGIYPKLAVVAGNAVVAVGFSPRAKSLLCCCAFCLSHL